MHGRFDLIQLIRVNTRLNSLWIGRIRTNSVAESATTIHDPIHLANKVWLLSHFAIILWKYVRVKHLSVDGAVRTITSN